MEAFVINGAFRSQRITGQQRYATEVAERLVAAKSAVECRPSALVGSSRVLTWGWVQALAGRKPRTPLLSLTSRAPFVHPKHCLVVHDLFVLTNPEWFSKSYVASHAPLLRQQLRQSALVFAVSPATADKVRQEFGRDDVIVAPNAPSPVFLESVPIDPSVPARRNLHPGRYLLAVGSLDPRKNYRRLVEAHTLLPRSVQQEFPLVIVGGNAAVFSSEEAVSSNTVRFTGYITDPELAQLYRQATAVVLSSLDEGFGLPAVEALGVGASLAVSDIDVFRWVCGEQALYFDPHDAVAIAEAMTLLIEAPAPGAETIAVRRSAAGRFNWDDTAKRISMKIAGLS